jgi:cytochrome bd ubiquinol oxidase subunit II
MTLQIFWFCLIAVLWGGYFVLEGFDFGVGALLPFLPRDESDRTVLFESIGSVWDGNEVWLVVAGGATFAAFPVWYATMFSGFYLALVLVLFFLIVRVVSFEWRSKSDSPRWRAVWLWANAIGSVGAPFVWGIALSTLLHGLPLSSSGDYAGDFSDLFSGYAIVGGIATVLLFGFHGATFLTLRTTGDLCKRASRAARRLALPAAVVMSVFLAWTVQVAVARNDKDVFPPILPAALGIAALAACVLLARSGRSGWVFATSAVAIAFVVATIFTSLYPRVLVSDPNFGNSLTVANAASAHYTLAVITVFALVLTPVVLGYQGWTYYVLRARLTGPELPAETGELQAH